MSPTTIPSGWADKSNRMIRSLGSAPIAESMSAYLVTFSVLRVPTLTIFRYLQKYEFLSSVDHSFDFGDAGETTDVPLFMKTRMKEARREKLEARPHFYRMERDLYDRFQ